MAIVDLGLQDPQGRLVLTAEIKNVRGTTKSWASAFRRNLMAHGGFPVSEFFLIVTPDRLYVWKNASGDSNHVPPDYEIAARPIFQPYYLRSAIKPEEMSTPAFELLVANWLTDLAQGQEPGLLREQGWLVESDLLRAVKNGRITYEVAAA